MGSGLQVVQEVHVKNRCAWLNHSSDPATFLRLVQRFPNIRLWFSGVRLTFHRLSVWRAAQGAVTGCKVAALQSPRAVTNTCSTQCFPRMCNRTGCPDHTAVKHQGRILHLTDSVCPLLQRTSGVLQRIHSRAVLCDI